MDGGFRRWCVEGLPAAALTPQAVQTHEQAERLQFRRSPALIDASH